MQIGSARLVADQLAFAGPDVPQAVLDLVDDVYIAANKGVLASVDVPLGSLSLEQLDKAEGALLAIARLLYAHVDHESPLLANRELSKRLSDDFYAAIPCTQRALIDNEATFNAMQELCQVLRDLVGVHESAGCALFGGRTVRYQALGASIELADAGEVQGIAERLGSDIVVEHVFRVKRAIEHELFRDDIGNQRLLFHGTKAVNMVGVLSRGLLLPQFAGASRRDLGKLGAGIYFADQAMVSAQYTTPSPRGSRYMFVANVALGHVEDYTAKVPQLRTCPEGADSVRGVPGPRSAFDDEEFAVFDNRQQQLKYIVQYRTVTAASDAVEPSTAAALLDAFAAASPPPKAEALGRSAAAVNLDDVMNVPDPLAKVKSVMHKIKYFIYYFYLFLYPGPACGRQAPAAKVCARASQAGGSRGRGRAVPRVRQRERLGDRGQVRVPAQRHGRRLWL